MDMKEMSSWGLSKAIYDVIENGFYGDMETGEVFFTADDLEALNEALDSKLNGICGFIKYAEAKADALKQRKQELEDNMKYYQNKADKLKEFLKTYMEANGIDKTKDVGDYRLGFRKSSSVDVFDEEKVKTFLEENPQYKETCEKTETTTKIVKTGLKEVLTAIEVPGARIVESKNISIK